MIDGPHKIYWRLLLFRGSTTGAYIVSGQFLIVTGGRCFWWHCSYLNNCSSAVVWL